MTGSPAAIGLALAATVLSSGAGTAYAAGSTPSAAPPAASASASPRNDATAAATATATASATGKGAAEADLGVKWVAPTEPVQPGRVPVSLVITNFGPGPGPASVVVRLDLTGTDKGYEQYPQTFPPQPGCWTDIGTITCELSTPISAGDSVSLPFAWKFDESQRGRVVRVPTSFYGGVPGDSHTANNETTLVLRVATKSGSHNPVAASPTAPGNSPSPRDPGLAATGAGPTRPLLLSGAAFLLLGTLALTARRRRERS